MRRWDGFFIKCKNAIGCLGRGPISFRCLLVRMAESYLDQGFIVTGLMLSRHMALGDGR